jgi:hypothetical protein
MMTTKQMWWFGGTCMAIIATLGTVKAGLIDLGFEDKFPVTRGELREVAGNFELRHRLYDEELIQSLLLQQQKNVLMKQEYMRKHPGNTVPGVWDQQNMLLQRKIRRLEKGSKRRQ